MSSEYMRQILESVNRAHTINEGYEDRVNDVVAVLNSYHPDGITKKQFQASIEQAGKEAGAVEMKSAQAGLNQKIGDSKREFIKDVAAKINFKRDTTTADNKREKVDQALQRLAYIIQEEVGNSWPDGDPWDHIAPRARKLGIPVDRLLEWLDRATRKYIGKPYKDYHDYVASTWEDFQDQTMDTHDLGDRRNPWR